MARVVQKFGGTSVADIACIQGAAARVKAEIDCGYQVAVVVSAMGGSTNAVLHLLAIAHEADVPLDIDDFDRLSRSTPYLTDLRPGGRFVMSDVDRVGGVPVVLNELLAAGLLHGDA